MLKWQMVSFLAEKKYWAIAVKPGIGCPDTGLQRSSVRFRVHKLQFQSLENDTPSRKQEKSTPVCTQLLFCLLLLLFFLFLFLFFFIFYFLFYFLLGLRF